MHPSMPCSVEKNNVAGPISMTQTRKRATDHDEVSAEDANAYLVYINSKKAEPYMDQLFGGKRPGGATELRDILNKDRKTFMLSTLSTRTRTAIREVMDEIVRTRGFGLKLSQGDLNHTLSKIAGKVRVEQITAWFFVCDKEILGVMPVNCSTPFA